MNERHADFELLRAFARAGDQRALAEVIRRHLDLVYATALRKVEDAGAAEEISQNVFTALARKTWQFAPDDSLPAWLHKTALLESKSWLRGELRRRRREQTAAELGTTMKTSTEQPAFNALVPLLDEALLSLREKDRTALLLRYYEAQSLRDVGASLGVAEDAAQKRVAGALEKLAAFFQRRGFKTATVAASATALQHTAASASAATATGVVNAATQSAPPVLVGLSGLLARLASLPKAQVAALCLVVTALPVAWQWNELRSVEREAAREQANLDSLRLEQTTLETEIQELTETWERLNALLVKAAAVEAQNAEASRKLASWKTRIRNALTADDYHWPEHSPFVRIPKSAVPRLAVHMPMGPPGVITREARELLGLTPRERAALEAQLHNYFADIDRMIGSAVYETNHSFRVAPPASAIASKIVFVPALGEVVKASSDWLAAEMKAVLGEQRWPLVESQLNVHGTHTLRRILGLDAGDDAQEVSVWIRPDKEGTLTVGYHWATKGGAFSYDGAPLASVLPDVNLEGGRSAIDDVQRNNLPGAVTTRMLTWLQEQAEARLGKESKP